MKLFLLFNLVYLSIIKLHYNIQNQLIEKIQDKLKNGDYACLDIDDNYIIHLIKLNRSEVAIRRFEKLKGFTHTVSIKLEEHLDEDLNLKESLKSKIIQQLYSFKDEQLKYIFISEEDDLYKNEMYLFEFLKNLKAYINMIENYDESKEDYLKYESVIRNSYLFRKYTYEKNSEDIEFFSEDYDKQLFSLVSLGEKNELYFFTFDMGSFDTSEYFRYYYIKKNVISEENADIFLRFVNNFNFETYEIDLNQHIIDISTEKFIDKRKSMDSEDILLTRKINIDLNENHIICNSICYFYNDEIIFDEILEYFPISRNQFEEIKNFFSEINEIDYTTLYLINRLMNVLKGSEIYLTILKNILNNRDSGKGLILINILYSLAIITKSQFDDYLYNQSSDNIDIKDIIKQINCHHMSVRFSLYNILLHSELSNIANSQNNQHDLFKDFDSIMSIASVKEKMNLSDNDNLSIIKKLNIFIEKVYYKSIYSYQEFNFNHSSGIFLLISRLISDKIIVNEDLILKYTEDNFSKDFLSLIYDELLLDKNDD